MILLLLVLRFCAITFLLLILLLSAVPFIILKSLFAVLLGIFVLLICIIVLILMIFNMTVRDAYFSILFLMILTIGMRPCCFWEPLGFFLVPWRALTRHISGKGPGRTYIKPGGVLGPAAV